MNKSFTNRLDTVFARAREKGAKVFMPFITAGDPSLEQTEKIVTAMCRGGADIIELGVPFSDPLADGPVIQRASYRSLENGTNLPRVLALVSRMRQNNMLGSTPVVLLLYYNTVYAYGVEKFARDAAAAGVDGAVVPDLPLEAGQSLRRLGKQAGLSLIAMVTPTTGRDRAKKIVDHAAGFIYYTAVTGVTGKRDTVRQQLAAEIDRLKQITDLPVLLGFGIANREQARQAVRFADGIIMGSALVELVEKHPARELPARLETFVRDIKTVC